MNNIQYPTKENLSWWIEYIKKEPGEGSFLRPYLPRINERWIEKIMWTVNQIQQPYYPKDVHIQAALLFYKINKAHNEIDSNKRSSIIATYLFYLLNDYLLYPPEDIRIMAKKIARSKGRKNQDKWIDKITKFLSDRVEKLH